MKGIRYSTEQKIRILREAESSGKTIEDVWDFIRFILRYDTEASSYNSNPILQLNPITWSCILTGSKCLCSSLRPLRSTVKDLAVLEELPPFHRHKRLRQRSSENRLHHTRNVELPCQEWFLSFWFPLPWMELDIELLGIARFFQE